MSKRELLAKIISRFTFENNRDSARNTIEILNNFTSKDDEAKAIRQRENRDSAFDRLKEFAHKIYISEAQHRKTTAIIMNSILPYLRSKIQILKK